MIQALLAGLQVRVSEAPMLLDFELLSNGWGTSVQSPGQKYSCLKAGPSTPGGRDGLLGCGVAPFSVLPYMCP